MRIARAAAVCLALLPAGVARGSAGGHPTPPSGQPPGAAVDACTLLSDAEIRAIQGQPIAERVHREQARKFFRVAQCVYPTPDIVNSVSLALTLPLTARAE